HLLLDDRQHVERADPEDPGPPPGGGDHVVDHEPVLEEAVLALRPRLLVQAHVPALGHGHIATMRGVLSGEKILITGPAGRIAFGLARMLAADNEVWGIARFRDPASREEVDGLGVTTRVLDYGDGDFTDLPDDFTYLLHIAADFGEDYERGLRVNAEGTGLLLSHCRGGKAALVMSTVTVYKPHPDPWHPFREDDPIGDAGLPHPQPYSIVKIAEEAVARYCARA